MKLIKKTVLLHGGREVHVLIPEKVNTCTTVIEYPTGQCIMSSNGTGYGFLSSVFALAGEIKENEMIYLPLKFSYIEEYSKWYLGDINHFTGAVLFNYCEGQFKTKDIILALKSKTCRESLITRINRIIYEEYIENWKTYHRLTIKKHGALLIISTNSDGFSDLAISCANLAEYGDDTQYNNFSPHKHHDWNENTSKSLGITLYYWQPYTFVTH